MGEAGRASKPARETDDSAPESLPVIPSLLSSCRTKLVVLVGAAMVVIATAVGASGYILAQSNLRQQIDHRLEAVVSGRAALLRAHLNHLQREVALITSRTRLRRLLVERHRAGTDGAQISEIEQILEDVRSSVDLVQSLELLTTRGRVLTSDDEAAIGSDRSADPVFVAGQKRSFLGDPVVSADGGVRAPLVAPIRSADNGEIVAVLWVEVDMSPVAEAIVGMFPDWRSGEIAIARFSGDRAEFVLRPSLEHGAPVASIDQFPGLTRALRGQDGLLQSRDYRNQVVLEAHRAVVLDQASLARGPWAIVAKVDASEAYAPVKRMRRFTILLASILGLLTLGIAYWFASRLAAPIIGLTETALSTAADCRAPIELPRRNDEIGALAVAFEYMRGQLVAHQEVLETRVAERTADLETVNRRLTAEIHEREHLTNELRSAKEAAEASSQAKSTFLAAMSHEIRTPMNGIVGMAELLASTPLAPIQREYLGMVQESAESLLQVINDILDFSRIETGRLTLETVSFDLRELVGNTARTFAVGAHKKSLELTVRIAPEVPEVVIGDPLRLRQVLVNLLGNAIRFTERGEVAVEVEQARREDGRTVLELVVRDTGIGIAKKRMTAIFEPFEQADTSTSRSHGGTGLGLTIAQRIVVRMGGTIDVRSRVGSGTTFRVTIPFEIGAARGAPRSLAALEGSRVLVVDDNRTNRLILEEVLSQWNMEVTSTADPNEVLELLLEARGRGEAFHVALLDVNMPGLDGFTLAEQIIANDHLGSPTILMLSSTDHPEDMRRCKQLGVTYLLKPIKQSDLLEAIQETLGLRPPTEEPAPPAEEPLPRLRLLVAEDNPVSQRLATELLDGWGHQVVLAQNGHEAVEAFRHQPADEPFDLILMDVQMPEIDGFEATAMIRALEAETGGRVPIVAMTAHAMKGDRERCLAAGMDGYVAKPVRAKELRFTLERYAPAPEPRAETNDPVPVIDWKRALERLDGRDAILRSMAEAFVADCPARIEAIGRAVANGDARALLSAAHALKGAAQAMSAEPVAELAARLEKAGRSGDLAGAGSWVDGIEIEAARLLEVLSEYLGGSGDSDEVGGRAS